MVSVNIYKIYNEYLDEFLNELNEKEYVNSFEDKSYLFDSEYFEEFSLNFNLSLYSNENIKENDLSWNWIRSAFGLNSLSFITKPKAVLLIKEIRILKDNENNSAEENFYAISLGHAYQNISGYCDRLWAYSFAEHLSYESVKSMNILSPNSIINKKINNYSNFNKIELNSGEALNQLTANIEIDEDIEFLKNNIIISNSIKFDIKEPNLKFILNLIDYVNYCNISETKLRIPYFKQCHDKILKRKLNENMINVIYEDIRLGRKSIDICEFFIINNEIKFLNQFTDFNIVYKKHNENLDYLSINNIYGFIDSNLTEEDNILDIQISFKETETGEYFNRKFKNMIIFDNLEEPYIFDEGKWFVYNDVYMNDLKDSLDDIDVFYDDKYDFTEEDYNNFLQNKSEEFDLDFNSMTEEQAVNFKRKWYKELCFNKMREGDGFICNDRSMDNVKGHSIEVADLFKIDENAMYSVKIGSGSSDLSYVVDQSLIAITNLDNGEIKEIKNENINQISKNDIQDVYLWLILKRINHLPLNDEGNPDLNSLKNLILKNKIDYWKKEVIMSRRNPKIRINYINF